MRSQVDGKNWSYQSVPETSTTQWLEEHAPEGARIGYDPEADRSRFTVSESGIVVVTGGQATKNAPAWLTVG